jgi:hypothetical protein
MLTRARVSPWLFTFFNIASELLPFGSTERHWTKRRWYHLLAVLKLPHRHIQPALLRLM